MWNALNDLWDNYRNHNNTVEILSVPAKVACCCELNPPRRETALDRRLSLECLTRWSAVVEKNLDPLLKIPSGRFREI